MSDMAAKDTDRELYREGGGDGNGQSYYEPSVHVTADGRIGMNVGGSVVVLPIREWHALATASLRQVEGSCGNTEPCVCGDVPEWDHPGGHSWVPYEDEPGMEFCEWAGCGIERRRA